MADERIEKLGDPVGYWKRFSAIHWDMLCDLRQGGQIWVDDQLLYENGHFTLDL